MKRDFVSYILLLLFVLSKNKIHFVTLLNVIRIQDFGGAHLSTGIHHTEFLFSLKKYWFQMDFIEIQPKLFKSSSFCVLFIENDISFSVCFHSNKKFVLPRQNHCNFVFIILETFVLFDTF